jgi:hypothetical protein
MNIYDRGIFQINNRYAIYPLCVELEKGNTAEFYFGEKIVNSIRFYSSCLTDKIEMSKKEGNPRKHKSISKWLRTT